MKFQECLDEGLIKRDSRAVERIENSLKMERFLKSAKKNIEIDEYEMTEIAAYNSAFHSARACFLKVMRERSHYCLSIALKYLYEKGKILELVKTFDKIKLKA